MGGRAGDSSSLQILSIDQRFAPRRVFSEHYELTSSVTTCYGSLTGTNLTQRKLNHAGAGVSLPVLLTVCAPCGILAVRPDWSLVVRLALMSTACKLESPE